MTAVTAASAPARIDAIERLRVLAMLSVVGSHATVSYMRYPTPELLWVVHDPATHGIFDVLFWSSGVVLSVFFLVAGFAAAAVYDRYGATGFVRERSRRLLGPFVAFGLIVLPLTFYIWAAGWWMDGRCTLNEIRRVKFAPPIQAHLFGPAHLWFLEYLIILCVAYWLVRTASRWWHARGLQRQSLVGCNRAAPPANGTVRVWWFVFASALILVVDVGAVSNLHNSFAPAPARLLYHGVFFAAGALWLRRCGSVERFLRPGALAAVLWVPVFAASFVLFRRHLQGPMAGVQRVLLGLTIAVFVWQSLLVCLGWGQSGNKRLWARVETLGVASYWIYLVHFPIVGAAQLALSRVDLPAGVKYVMVVACGVGISLWSWTAIRHTAVGRWLSGEARRDRGQAGIVQPEGSASEARVTA